MPTVLRVAGWRIVIYPNDHRPAHVHVIGNGNEVVFELNCAAGPVILGENYGFGRVELNRISKRLNNRVGELCSAWKKIHGD